MVEVSSNDGNGGGKDLSWREHISIFHVFISLKYIILILILHLYPNLQLLGFSLFSKTETAWVSWKIEICLKPWERLYLIPEEITLEACIKIQNVLFPHAQQLFYLKVKINRMADINSIYFNKWWFETNAIFLHPL